MSRNQETNENDLLSRVAQVKEMVKQEAEGYITFANRLNVNPFPNGLLHQGVVDIIKKMSDSKVEVSVEEQDIVIRRAFISVFELSQYEEGRTGECLQDNDKEESQSETLSAFLTEKFKEGYNAGISSVLIAGLQNYDDQSDDDENSQDSDQQEEEKKYKQNAKLKRERERDLLKTKILTILTKQTPQINLVIHFHFQLSQQHKVIFLVL